MKTIKSLPGITRHSYGRAVCALGVLLITAGAHGQNLFVSANNQNFGNGDIYEFTPGSSGWVQTTFATGLNEPFAIVFDRAGNLFEADMGSGNINEFTPGGVRHTFASGFSSPMALAFDPAGDLFVSEVYKGDIIKIVPGGAQSVFATGLSYPQSLACDSAGNVFEGDWASGNIFKFTPGGVQSTFATGVGSVEGLAFDGSGNLFMVGGSGGNIYKFTPGGVRSTYGAGTGDGVGVDSAGNLFIADTGSGLVYELGPGNVTSTVAAGITAAYGAAIQPCLAFINCTNVVATACSYGPVYYNPTASDNCCSNWTVVCNPPSGSDFLPGSTTPVTCTATDSCGNSISCTFTVTVLIGYLQVECPSNIVVMSCTNVPVFFPPPTITDPCCTSDCCTNGSWAYLPPSGSTFAVGTTNIVTCWALDGCGRSNNCSFTVTVLPDVNCPTCLQVECPSNIVVTSCTNVPVYFPPPTITDPCCTNDCCTNASWVYIPPSGSLFAVNTTNMVTCWALDGCGRSNGCSFTVAVDCGTNAYSQCNCTNYMQGNLVPNPGFETNTGCPTGISETDLAAPWFQPTAGTSDYFNACGASSVGVPSNEFGTQPAHGGQAYTGAYMYSVAGSPGAYFSVREYVETPLLAPLVGGHTYSVSFYVSLAAFSTRAVDNVGAYLSSYPATSTSGTNLPVIPQVRNTAGIFLNSANWTLIQGTYTAAGGEAYLTIGNFYDNADTPIQMISNNFRSDAYYYIDDVSVVDITPYNTCGNNCITIFNPGNITVSTCSNSLPVVYSAGACDCCCSNFTLVTVPASGYDFPLGTTRVTSTVTDDCGNSNSCSFDVTVIQNTNAPIILSCPAGITLCASNGCAILPDVTAGVTAVTATGGTNVVVTQNIPAGTQLCSDTDIVLTVADACGDATNCTVPCTLINCASNCLQIQCWTNMTVTSCTNVPVYYYPTATDNCCSNWTVVCNPASGSYFSPGTSNTVTCTATDSCGNSNSCTFTVTVLPGADCQTNCLQLVTSVQGQDLYVANTGNDTIEKFDSSGVGAVFAHTTGIDPQGLAFDNQGNLYVATFMDIEKFNSSGVGAVFAGSGTTDWEGLAFDGSGNLYAANGFGGSIWKFNPSGAGTVFASSPLNNPYGLTFDNAGNLFVSNPSAAQNIIEKFDPSGAGTLFANTGFDDPYGLAFDSAGNLYESSLNGQYVAKYNLSGSSTIFVPVVNSPTSVAFDSAGNLYVASYVNNTITKYNPSGVGTLFANSGLNAPGGLAFGPASSASGPTNIVVTSCTNIPVVYSLSVTDTCCTNFNVTYSPASGSYFPPGTTNTVTAAATDSCGNSNSWSFTVTVLPGVNCPTNCLQFQSPGNIEVASCTNVAVFYPGLIVSNACCSNTVVFNPPSGSSFAPETSSLVNWAVYNCSGTNPIASGSFWVSVFCTNCCPCVNYTNYTVKVFPGDNYLADWLCQGTNNALADVLPVVPDGTEVYFWNQTLQLFNPSADTFTGGHWSNGTEPLSPGEGFLLISPATTNLTIYGSVPGCGGSGCTMLDCSSGIHFIGGTGLSPIPFYNLFCPPVPSATEVQEPPSDSNGNVSGAGLDAYVYFNGNWSPGLPPALPVGYAEFVKVDASTPTINCPSNIVTNSCVAVPVSFQVTASDGFSDSLTPTVTSTSGSLFKVGTTQVNCVVTNGCGGRATCSFSVTVVCTNSGPPIIIIPTTGTGVIGLSWPTGYDSWHLLVQTGHLQLGVSSNTNDWDIISGVAGTNKIFIPFNLTNPGAYFRLHAP